MDYTQLTDDELRRKVLELMGYSVEFETETYDEYGGTFPFYTLYLNGDDTLEVSDTEAGAWQQAPDPLTDANVYMGLLDEIGDMCLDKVSGTWNVYDINSSAILAESTSIGRAICEVYCQVKEQK